MTPLRGATVKMLVADDNRDSADVLAIALGLAGYTAEACYDGAQAWDRLRAWQPDIAILDIGMPHPDGLEIARRVRAAPWGGQVRLIALSGWGQQRDVQAARGAGFDHHMIKPVELAEVERVLTEMLAANSNRIDD